MAHEHLRNQPVAVALAAEVADAALAPVLRLIPARAVDYLRERVDNLCFLHPVVSTVFARVVKARLAAQPADDLEIELPIAARKPDRARKQPEPANDTGPLTPAEIERRRRHALVLGARPIANALAKSYARRGAGAFDDLAQDAMLAIVQCASSFEDKRKVAFSTYAYAIVERALIDRLRRATVIRRRTVRDAGIEITSSKPTEDDEGALFAHAQRLVVSELLGLDDDPFADPEDRVMRAQRRQALARALESLEPDERRFVELYYEEDWKVVEIGIELGWGGERTVQRRHLDILDRLHARLREWARRERRRE